jgi:hypothetical protein
VLICGRSIFTLAIQIQFQFQVRKNKEKKIPMGIGIKRIKYLLLSLFKKKNPQRTKMPSGVIFHHVVKQLKK